MFLAQFDLLPRRVLDWLEMLCIELGEHLVQEVSLVHLNATITGAVESTADTMEKIIEEVAAARQTERGNRADDKRSETAMEDRKKEGYF